MHSHDRTMLARFGFADPDRKEPLHDVACRYLTQETVVKKLADLLGLTHSKKHIETSSERGDVARVFGFHRFKFEKEIIKGSGQYKTTVGFMDLILGISVKTEQSDYQERWCDGVYWNEEKSYWKDFNRVFNEEKTIGIEVKIIRTSVSDLLRQVNLYRGYQECDSWVVATAYQLSKSEIETLVNEKIFHVYLGDSFQRFATIQEQQEPVENVEI